MCVCQLLTVRLSFWKAGRLPSALQVCRGGLGVHLDVDLACLKGGRMENLWGHFALVAVESLGAMRQRSRIYPESSYALPETGLSRSAQQAAPGQGDCGP